MKKNTYKGKLTKIYAEQVSKINEKAAFLCISGFLVSHPSRFGIPYAARLRHYAGLS